MCIRDRPDGTWVERTTFAWTDLKYFLLWTAIIAIIVVITTVIVVAHFYEMCIRDRCIAGQNRQEVQHC